MSNLPKENKEGELMLFFHVGSSFVEGSFFLAQKSGIPKVIFSTEEPILTGETANIGKLLNSTIQALQTVAERAHKAGVGEPKRVFCVLSSPWYVSQVRTINLEKNAPFVFTTKMADSLIKKEVSLFKEKHFPKQEEGIDSFRIIEVKNIKTILNGYETNKPVNQKIKELKMSVFVSMSGESVLKKIENILGQYFRVKQIEFSSFAMASFAVVRDMYPDRNDFLLVDVGGEVSDIFMAKKNALRESATFPLGSNFFIRGFASHLNITLAEADSLFSLLKDGHMEGKQAKKLTPLVNQLKEKWLKQFGESLAGLSNEILIPSDVYITADKGMAEFFGAIIKTEQYNQYTSTDSKFKIIPLNTPTLHGVTVFEDNVIRDPFIIMDSIYINRFLTKI